MSDFWAGWIVGASMICVLVMLNLMQPKTDKESE